ncbi:hypothetical protein SY88_08055 [Clostridiales bacterium PH28_bin88]|nr:hypothetical protein SY88_08055 [Clostridiales bacterium PH28_bin88]
MNSRNLGRNKVLLVVAMLLLMAFVAACAAPRSTQQPTQPEENKSAQQQQPTSEQFQPRRGCLACHVKTEKKDYSLTAEAMERAEAAGGKHPTKTPAGDTMDENTKVEACLTCHGTGPNGRAKAAPLDLRTILHPSHMFSETFVGKYRGNCWTCHEVDGRGTFYLLGEKVETNEKGIPKTVPIPNMIAPSEGGK